MYDNLNPVGTDSHIGICFGYFFNRWQFGLQILGNLVEEHNSSSSILIKFPNGLLAIEHVYQLLIIYESNKEAAAVNPILFLNHVSQIQKSELIVYHDTQLIVLVVLIQVVLNQKALDFLVPRVWDWKRNHQEWIERNRYSFAKSALQCRLKLTVEKITNYGLVPQDMFVPGLLACHGI